MRYQCPACGSSQVRKNTAGYASYIISNNGKAQFVDSEFDPDEETMYACDFCDHMYEAKDYESLLKEMSNETKEDVT